MAAADIKIKMTLDLQVGELAEALYSFLLTPVHMPQTKWEIRLRAALARQELDAPFRRM